MSLHGKQNKRILIISHFYYPDVTAAAFRIKETADILSQMGFKVHVIAGEPHKGQVGNNTLDDGNIVVTRVPLIKYSGKGKWNYILHYLSFMFGAIYASWKHPSRFDIVWATSPPLFTGISGLAVSILKKAKYVLDIRDIWPESAVVAGQISSTGLLFKAAKIVEKFLYNSADYITCVAKPMAKYIASISSNSKTPTVIYNSIPQSMIENETKDCISNKTDILNILYIGNMGICQNLDLVLDAAKLLTSKGINNVKYTLVGKGTETEKLINRVHSENIMNVEIKGIVPKSEAIHLIQTANALMLHLKDDGTMNKTIPSKVFDYMAGGKPILFGLKGEATEILGSVSGNLYYDPASAEQLANQSISLANNYTKLAKQAKQNKIKVKAEFTREKMVERLADVFIEALKDKG